MLHAVINKEVPDRIDVYYDAKIEDWIRLWSLLRQFGKVTVLGDGNRALNVYVAKKKHVDEIMLWLNDFFVTAAGRERLRRR